MAFAAHKWYTVVDLYHSTGDTDKTVLTQDVGRSTEQTIYF